MRIYNTLTRKKERFDPIEEGVVRMYVCGPTVYDVPHIGHARSAYVFDVLRRYLEKKALRVVFVRNVTDVDDKIIDRARGELKREGVAFSGDALKRRTREVAERYLECYTRCMAELGIAAPTHQPTATESIPDMIKAIETLIDKGHAYVSGGDVYFAVDSYENYGRLSGRERTELLSGVRRAAADTKRGRLDFALWKSAKENEPSWPSPWGEGRPGWHIECSVMSTSLLGACFDIHGGGLDLLFPHHENEMAQAEALTGKPFARWWVHNGLLTVRGEKMSKSLGNYITVKDFLSKYGDGDILKLAFLLTHYRKDIDCTDERFHEAGQIRERIMIFLERAGQVPGECSAGTNGELTAGLGQKMTSAMEDDVNTPAAVAVMLEAVRLGNEALNAENIECEEKKSTTGAYAAFVREWAGLFALDLERKAVTGQQRDVIERLVQEREEARRSKDYERSDLIRQTLREKGVIVEDTPEGPVWRKN